VSPDLREEVCPALAIAVEDNWSLLLASSHTCWETAFACDAYSYFLAILYFPPIITYTFVNLVMLGPLGLL
jgi:hypothetical protein